MIRTMLVSALFRQFGSCFGLLTLQDKHNICTMSEDINLICTRCETGQKSSLFYLFLKLVQINIFSKNHDVCI